MTYNIAIPVLLGLGYLLGIGTGFLYHWVAELQLKRREYCKTLNDQEYRKFMEYKDSLG